jgi:hypothetical protein
VYRRFEHTLHPERPDLVEQDLSIPPIAIRASLTEDDIGNSLDEVDVAACDGRSVDASRDISDDYAVSGLRVAGVWATRRLGHASHP